MTKTLKLRITQEDIDNGIPYDSSACPVVLAFRREYGLIGGFAANMFMMRKEDIPLVLYTESKFAYKFDRGLVNKPTTLTFKEVEGFYR